MFSLRTGFCRDRPSHSSSSRYLSATVDLIPQLYTRARYCIYAQINVLRCRLSFIRTSVESNPPSIPNISPSIVGPFVDSFFSAIPTSVSTMSLTSVGKPKKRDYPVFVISLSRVSVDTSVIASTVLENGTSSSRFNCPQQRVEITEMQAEIWLNM